jgi:glycine cleavage system H protein
MDTLTFMMGEFEAEFPTDRQYAKNHMWAEAIEDQPGKFRFGFTAYSVRLLQDVYFLDWDIETPAELALGQEFGSIESKKAESSLYSPLAGTLVEFNPVLMEDPSAINVDKYQSGWLFDMATSDNSPLMSAESYVELLVDVWDKTQRTIKGQLNE